MKSAVIEPGILESLRRTSSKPGAGAAPASLRRRPFDEIGVELAKAGAVCLLSDTHNHTFVLGQIQRLQGLEHALLINGIDFDGHI
jgi:hypothetical protein